MSSNNRCGKDIECTIFENDTYDNFIYMAKQNSKTNNNLIILFIAVIIGTILRVLNYQYGGEYERYGGGEVEYKNEWLGVVNWIGYIIIILISVYAIISTKIW